MSPRLLDLFCGAGGAGEGYRRAGFDVTGVDIKPQKNTPYRVIHGDALEYLEAHGAEYDAIHASPPCQACSKAAQAQRNQGKVYPDLIAATRCSLEKIGKLWIIENVPGSPMRPDFKLCGCQFRLDIRRERWFETSWNALVLTASCQHPYPVVSVVGHGTPAWVRQKLGFNPAIKRYRSAMGIGWMNRNELSQAIPPAFTEYIGRFLMETMELSGTPSVQADRKTWLARRPWKQTGSEMRGASNSLLASYTPALLWAVASAARAANSATFAAFTASVLASASATPA